MDKPVATAVIGLGGFAGSHHAALRRLEERGVARLAATCDPRPDAFADKMAEWQFEPRGVRLFDDWQVMLDTCAHSLDLVTIPTPIPLHAAMHRACVERGLPVYLEKPPTLWWEELEQMIAVDEQAARQTNVGFNWIVDPQRQALKEQLLTGAFGRLRRVSVYGYWPRPASYYQRNNWAARLLLDGRPVLDSPTGNALAHLLHNTLFWAGSKPWSWATPESVRAELYRANAIEGFDTVFATARLTGDVELRLAMTHACPTTSQAEIIECDHARITYHAGAWVDGQATQRAEIAWADGRHETLVDRTHADYMTANLAAYIDYLHGTAARPMTTLADSRPLVWFNNLLYLASGTITTVDARHLGATDAQVTTIDQVIEAGDELLASGRLPSEQERPWARAGGEASCYDDLPRLRELLTRLTSG